MNPLNRLTEIARVGISATLTLCLMALALAFTPPPVCAEGASQPVIQATQVPITTTTTVAPAWQLFPSRQQRFYGRIEQLSGTTNGGLVSFTSNNFTFLTSASGAIVTNTAAVPGSYSTATNMVVAGTLTPYAITVTGVTYTVTPWLFRTTNTPAASQTFTITNLANSATMLTNGLAIVPLITTNTFTKTNTSWQVTTNLTTVLTTNGVLYSGWLVQPGQPLVLPRYASDPAKPDVLNKVWPGSIFVTPLGWDVTTNLPAVSITNVFTGTDIFQQ